MASTTGRRVEVPLTNQTGGGVVAGDAVAMDTAHDDSFVLDTSGAYVGIVGIVQETIAAGATGRVLLQGEAALVNVSASVTRGHFGKLHTVGKQVVDAGASRGVGTFVQFKTGGTTPKAIVFNVDLLGSSLTNPMTLVGDIIVGGAAGAPQALAAVAAGKVLASAGVTTQPAWAFPPYHGCRIHHSTTQTVVSGTTQPLIFDTDLFDTDGYHFTSEANLTGTLAKTATSAAIVGTSTLFTTELSVGQVISIPGTAVEVGVVKTITDNTHLTLWQTMANNASGQTGTRRSEFVAIPSGMGGLYRMIGGVNWTVQTIDKDDRLWLFLNGTVAGGGTALAETTKRTNTAAGNNTPGIELASEHVLVPGDYLSLAWANLESATVTLLGAGSGGFYTPRLSVVMVGQ